MKSNLTLILLFSVTALLALYNFGSLQGEYQNSGVVFSEKFLEQLESVKFKRGLDELTLAKSKQELSFGLEKKLMPGQWLVTSPTPTYPNIESLNKLFSSLIKLKVLNQVDSGAKPEFGLTEPVSILEVLSKEGKKVLKIGAINPVSKRRYAQIEGDSKVILLDDGEVGGLLKLELRDLRPLKIAAKNVKRFSIEGRASKSFSRVEGTLKMEGEENLEPKLIEQYLEAILLLPAIRTVKKEEITGTIHSTLSLDFQGLNGNTRQSVIQVHSTKEENFVVNFSDASIGYEYGPEIERLLNRKIETFFNKRLLREIVLKDFFGSCPELPKNGCRPNESSLTRIQEALQRVEVLDLERLPGRLMTPARPECLLKLENPKVLFEIGARVNGDEVDAGDSPRFFVSDIGTTHYRGVISGIVAREFCEEVKKLCHEAKASCAG